jgi:thiol-disulfide isomerase/thioredoxin
MKGRLCLLFFTAASALGVTVGETYDQLVAEKGAPIGSMGAGSVRILNYPDAVIKVEGGIVVSVRSPGKAQAVVSRTAAVPASFRPAPAPASGNGPAVWETDFGAAMDQARARKCHVFILYTGSDWCPWCKKMEAEVYSQPEFARYSREKFVLLKLDYLRHKPLSVSANAQNEEMAQRYKINSFPNAVIVDTDARVVGKLSGYRAGGPVNFIRMLQQFE